MTSRTTAQTVSLSVEIPEELQDALQGFLEARTGWEQDRVFGAAIALFLMQNGVNQRQVNRVYLDNVFGCAV
ncbi:MAG: DUF2811 domain-containing protein [Cyanobacteria bacterium P01_F01_bin.3]